MRRRSRAIEGEFRRGGSRDRMVAGFSCLGANGKGGGGERGARSTAETGEAGWICGNG